jgi:hypothetical protein
MHPIFRRLYLAIPAALVLASALLPTTAEAQRPRVIVLSFEGRGGDVARRAVVNALETRYELIDEDAAVRAAGDIGVDVSTPDGMSAVVDHLHIELVVGGSVEGRGRSASTSIWVSDTQGNELATATGPSASGRSGASEVGELALSAVEQAYTALHPPLPAPVEVDDTPPVMVNEEEDERASPAPRDDRDRWRLPIVRALIGLDFRNRTASISPNSASARFDADIFPTLAFQIESHPLAFSDGLENGLYVSLAGAFSAGITYTNGIDFQPYNLNTYFFEGNVGYGGVIANMVEIGGTLGMGVDGVGLDQRAAMSNVVGHAEAEFPSTEMFYFRPAIYARVRLFEDLVQLEGGFGGRILIGAGQLGLNEAQWNDGFASGGGIDFNLGLGGIIDPGFSYAARFGYSGHYVSLSDSARSPASTGATDEAFHIQLFVGWALMP